MKSQNKLNNSLEKYCSSLPISDELIFADGIIYAYDPKDVEILETLGSGQFVVEKIYHKPSEKFMAAKNFNIPFHRRYGLNKEGMEKITNEIRILYSLAGSSRSIIDFYGWAYNSEKVQIFMEPMKMSLQEVILKMKSTPVFARVAMKITRPIAIALVDALIALNERNIVHRDVKPANILVNMHGTIKLCDFSEGYFLDSSNANECVAGSLAYWPPEKYAIDDEDYRKDEKQDIWSLGIIILEIIIRENVTMALSEIRESEKFAFNSLKNVTGEQIFQHIFSTHRRNDYFNRELKEFVSLCLNPLDKRATSKMLRETDLYKIKTSRRQGVVFFKPRTMMAFLSYLQKSKTFEDDEFYSQKNLLDFPNYQYKVDFSVLSNFNLVHRRLYGIYPFVEYLAYYCIPAKTVISLKSGGYSIEVCRNEFLFLKKLQNVEHIIKCYGWCTLIGAPYLCLEGMDLCLKKLVHLVGPTIPESILGYMTVAILQTLSYINKHGYGHGNVNKEIFFIKLDGTIKIGSVGYVWNIKTLHDNHEDDDQYFHIFKHEEYIPPERFENKAMSLDYKNDIWGLGATLMECMSQIDFMRSIYRKCGYQFTKRFGCAVDMRAPNIKTIRKRRKQIMIMQKNTKGIRESRVPHDCYEASKEIYRNILENMNLALDQSNFSEEYKRFVRSCLCRIENRLSAKELKESEFYKNHLLTIKEDRQNLVELLASLTTRNTPKRYTIPKKYDPIAVWR